MAFSGLALQSAFSIICPSWALPTAPIWVAATADGNSAIYRLLQPGEQVEQNNVQQALVEVRDGREKILYVEGEPRYEMRFIRAAVEADSNIQVVALQRTAENKFKRFLDTNTPEELARLQKP
jgi:hypothetical protein